MARCALAACVMLVSSSHVMEAAVLRTPAPGGLRHGDDMNIMQPGSALLAVDIATCTQECKSDAVERWEASCHEIKANFEKVEDAEQKDLIKEALKVCEQGLNQQDVTTACTMKCSRQTKQS